MQSTSPPYPLQHVTIFSSLIGILTHTHSRRLTHIQNPPHALMHTDLFAGIGGSIHGRVQLAVHLNSLFTFFDFHILYCISFDDIMYVISSWVDEHFLLSRNGYIFMRCHSYAHIYTHIYVWIYMYTYIYLYIYIYIYIYIHIYRYRYTYYIT